MSRHTIETLVAGLLFGVILALVIWLVRRIKTTARVVVGEEIVLGGSVEVADTRVRLAMGSIPGAGYRYVGPQAHLLELSRIPVWVVLVVMGAFPIGLVLMLLVRESITMEINILDRAEGAVARLTGQSERHVLGQVRESLASVSN